MGLDAASELQITGLANNDENEGVDLSRKNEIKKDDKKSSPRKNTKKGGLKQKNVMEAKYGNEEEHVETTLNSSVDSDDVSFNIEEETRREVVDKINEATSEQKGSQSEVNIDVKDVKIDIKEETLKEIEGEINKNMECSKNLDGENNFKCKICSKDFKRKQKASKHIESHLDQFTFSCEFCSKTTY